MSRLFSKKLLLLIIILLIAAYIALKIMFPAIGMGHPNGPVPVSAAEVIERNITQWNEYSGRLVPVDQAQVRPQVAGVIDKVLFTDGALVKKGDPLFTIDPRPYQAALDAAQAHATFADSEFKRAQSLMSDKAIPQREFDQRKSDAANARAMLTQARLNLEYTQVKAPISGRASRAEVTAGNLVETVPNAPLLTTIVANDKLYADFEIDEAHFIPYSHAGVNGSAGISDIPVMMALTGEPDFTHAGKIESFDNSINIASGTIRVRSVFDNADGQLVAGMFARIRLGSVGETKAILISDRAVGTDQSKKFVIVVHDDNKTEHREITLGDTSDGLRIVTSGLNAGDKIVVSGLQRIMMPGQEVKPEMVPMDANKDSGSAIQDSGKKEASPDAGAADKEAK